MFIHPLRVLTSLVVVASALACASSGAHSSRIAPVDIGSFTITNDLDPFTKRPSLAAATFDVEKDGMLQFSCGSHGLDIRIGVSGLVARAANTLTVRIAFDALPPSGPSIWLVQRQGLFTLAYLRPDLAPAFAAKAMTATEARLEVTNTVNSAVEVYRFSLSGLAAAKPMLSCWPQPPQGRDARANGEL